MSLCACCVHGDADFAVGLIVDGGADLFSVMEVVPSESFIWWASISSHFVLILLVQPRVVWRPASCQHLEVLLCTKDVLDCRIRSFASSFALLFSVFEIFSFPCLTCLSPIEPELFLRLAQGCVLVPVPDQRSINLLPPSPIRKLGGIGFTSQYPSARFHPQRQENLRP